MGGGGHLVFLFCCWIEVYLRRRRKRKKVNNSTSELQPYEPYEGGDGGDYIPSPLSNIQGAKLGFKPFAVPPI